MEIYANKPFLMKMHLSGRRYEAQGPEGTPFLQTGRRYAA